MTGPSQPPPWHVVIPASATRYVPAHEPAWRGAADTVSFAITAVFVALTGPVVGLLWSHWAPKLTLARLVPGSGAPFLWQFGPDAWFLLLTALAGVACGVAVYALGMRGPGTVLGLALGGSAAAAVAARVGFLAERAHTLSVMRVGRVNPIYLNILEFKLRAVGVAVAWPMAALLVYVLVLALRNPERSLP